MLTFAILLVALVHGRPRARHPNDLQSNKRPVGAPPAPVHFLGTVYNLWTTRDLWSGMVGVGNQIFQPFNLQACSKITPYPTSVVSSSMEYFSSTEQLQSAFSNEAGLTVSYAKIFGGSVQSSYKQTVSHFQERRSLKMYYSTKVATMKLQPSCLNTPFTPQFTSVLKKLPTSLKSINDFQTWKSLFFDVYGSHVATDLIISARMRYLSSVQATCDAKVTDLCVGACATFTGYGLNVQGCDTTCTNKSSSVCAKTSTVSVEFVGGNRTIADELVTHKIDPNIMKAWLDSVSITSGAGNINGFMPISTVLKLNGQTLLGNLADEVMLSGYLGGCYSNEQFVNSGGRWQCVCMLSSSYCKNGGTLDRNKCICDCCGDVNHGFSGATCSSTYGKCIKGSGSGNPSHACKSGNKCDDTFHAGHTCSPTQVCCNTDFHSLCCPLGSQCSCSSSSCSCANTIKCPRSVPAQYQNYAT